MPFTMKNKFVLIALAFSVVVFSSCQKEPVDDLVPGSNANRVKTYTETVTATGLNLSSTYDVTYDNSGRVIGIVSTTSPGDKFIYTYPSRSLYTMDIYNDGAISIHGDFLLNAASLPDSIIQYNDTKDTSTTGYTYNANQQLIRMREYDYSKATGSVLYNTTTYTYGTDGNLIKSQDTDGEVNTFEYYPNLVYLPPLVIGPITNASTKKVNLLKTHTVTTNGSFQGSATTTYTFDNKDRISIEKTVLTDGSIVEKTYTYY